MSESEAILGKERAQIKGLEGTLNDLVAFTFNDRFNLSKSPFTFVSLTSPATSERVYLGLMHHPLSGTHFSDVLGQAAPHKQGVRGIVADFNQAKASHKKSLEGTEGGGLDKLHREDPEIARAYIEFFNNHLGVWTKGLRNRQYDTIFGALPRLMVTYNADSLVDQLAAQWAIDATKDPAVPAETDLYQLSGLIVQDRATDFARYLLTSPIFLQGLRRPLDTPEAVIKRYHHLSYNFLRTKVLLHDYVRQLTHEDLRTMAITHFRQSGVILVDPAKRKVFAPDQQIPEIDFVDREKFWLRDQSAGRILVRSRLNTSGHFDWKVVQYDLNEPHGSYALPLWAWSKNQEGERRFLQQPEAVAALIQSGLGQYRFKADVMLGRVSAASFAPEVARYWQDKISLSNKEGAKTRRQEIRGAQVGPWVSLSDHAAQLLSSFNFRRLEEAVLHR